MEEEDLMGVNEQAAIVQDEQAHTQSESDKEHNFAAMRESLANQKKEMDELRQRNREMQEQMQLYQANFQQHKQQDAAPKRDPDDLITVAEAQRMIEERESKIMPVLAEMQYKAKYKDFDNVVTKENLEPILSEYPELKDVLRTSKDPNLLAYVIGAERARRGQSKASEQSEQAERAKRVIENAQKPGVASNAVGGSGALSKADYYRNLSTRDFNAHVEKVKRRLQF